MNEPKFWNDYPMDVECLSNIFTAVFRHAVSGTTWIFEVSDRVNQSAEFITFMRTLAHHPSCRMVTFNGLGYDYPLIHYLMRLGEYFTAPQAYEKSKAMINTPWNDRFKNQIWASDHMVKQVDLFKVNAFDGSDDSTGSAGLKQLEIAMNMACVVEFECDFDLPLPFDKIGSLIAYNVHDVDATELLYHETRKKLEFRDIMTDRLGVDTTNLSDVNIGAKIFIKRLEDHTPGICGKSGKWRQSPRDQMRLAECVLPYVSFITPPFQEILNRIQSTTITKTKGAFDGLDTQFAGMKFAFGTGGIHAAIEGRTFRAGAGRVIQARDVKSYYPNLAIKNRLHPEHLSTVFCDIYDEIYQERAATPKSDPQNEALKLALNGGGFGQTNSKFSPFYDPMHMLRITINGQLLLCMLCEYLATIPTIVLFNVNTDGIMLEVDEQYVPHVDHYCTQWENMTRLTLETDSFDLFCQRDVNNYMAREVGGKMKSKGAYEWQTGLDFPKYKKPGDGALFHKNMSVKIVTIAAQEFMTNGTPYHETINNCTDPFRFMYTLKTNRTDSVYLGATLGEYDDHLSPADPKGRPKKRSMLTGGEKQQRIGRYFASTQGEQLYKVMPPLARLAHHERPQAIQKGVPVRMCNDVYDFRWDLLDRQHYVDAAHELVQNTGFFNNAT